ncbi:MAG: hypothetical protein RR630_10385, partial [Coprobacillus sp.]
MTNFIFYLILAIADIWLFEFYLSKNLKLNKTKYKKFFYIIEILLMTCAYYVIQDSLILCAFLIVIITIISINKFQYSKKELLLSCTFFLIQYIIMRNIIIFTFIWIFDIPTLNTFLNWSLTYTILIEVAVHYLQFIIIIYLTKYKSKKVIVLHHFKSFSILLSFYFGIALVINNDKLFIFPNVGRTFIFVIIVYNVALIFFDRFQNHHEELEYDHEQLKSESSSDLVYFEEHLEGNEEIRSIKHDLDNHMIILSVDIESDNKVGALYYIKNIKMSIEIASATTHTGINSL